ncbi:hypothetical protein [Arthrobacter sp. zg-Y238]|uniref:hypothetical protein n=1 Tax=Arthrobacter sp. zg-Y238 TaxID=2964614 RepID=UPI00210394DD|nr:hypothetical protein [Arthrobacter sp. zg-Y238]MCQ1953646.1 hypothetical protein [Arthrobacter sp. zg-Y238]
MVIRFVAEPAGLDAQKLTPVETADLIQQVAELYPAQRRRLDHVIWRHVYGRDTVKADELV